MAAVSFQLARVEYQPKEGHQEENIGGLNIPPTTLTATETLGSRVANVFQLGNQPFQIILSPTGCTVSKSWWCCGAEQVLYDVTGEIPVGEQVIRTQSEEISRVATKYLRQFANGMYQTIILHFELKG